MKPSDIVALVASIFTAISGLSAAIACFFTYRTTRPKIKMTIGEKQNNRIYAFHKDKGFALLGIELINSSNVAGMIDNICIIYQGKEYFSENIFTKYDPSPFGVKSFFANQIEQDAQALHLKTPITVTGYSIVCGYVLFPTFPVIQTNTISVTIRYRLMNKKLKRKIRNVELYLITPTPA